MASKKETIEYIALPVLFIVLAIVMWKYAFSGEEASPPQPAVPVKTTAAAAKPKIPARNASTAPAASNEKVSDVTTLEALDVSKLMRKPVAVGKTDRGNIFNYWVQPPKPPDPPPPPPPIQLTGVEPRQVFALTKGFTLKLRGSEFPPSSKISIDGSEFPTTQVSGTELATEIPESYIRAAGNHKIIVRTSDPKLTHSNDAMLVVAPPPVPPYSYVGLITTGEGPTAILLDRETRRSVQKGQKIDSRGKWVVVDINSKEIQIRDTDLDIVHKVPFRGEA